MPIYKSENKYYVIVSINGKKITMSQYEEIENAIKAFCKDSINETQNEVKL